MVLLLSNIAPPQKIGFMLWETDELVLCVITMVNKEVLCSLSSETGWVRDF